MTRVCRSTRDSTVASRLPSFHEPAESCALTRARRVAPTRINSPGRRELRVVQLPGSANGRPPWRESSWTWPSDTHPERLSVLFPRHRYSGGEGIGVRGTACCQVPHLTTSLKTGQALWVPVSGRKVNARKETGKDELPAPLPEPAGFPGKLEKVVKGANPVRGSTNGETRFPAAR
jgi:hypothetical protein